MTAMPALLIQNGTVVNADVTTKADVLIDGATIKEVRAGIPASAAERVAAVRGNRAVAIPQRCCGRAVLTATG